MAPGSLCPSRQGKINMNSVSDCNGTCRFKFLGTQRHSSSRPTPSLPASPIAGGDGLHCGYSIICSPPVELSVATRRYIEWPPARVCP
jgi:hypothetical protein